MQGFEIAMRKLAPIEGGYTNDPQDSGGETNHGITVAVARAFGYAGLMAAMTLDAAQAIYRARYWDALRLDDVYAVSPPVALELFDSAVNCGSGMAARWLQRCLNVFNNQGALYPDVGVDGAMGPMTMAALREYLHERNSAAERVLFNALNALQGVHYIELAETRTKDERFAFGWFSERVTIS